MRLYSQPTLDAWSTVTEGWVTNFTAVYSVPLLQATMPSDDSWAGIWLATTARESIRFRSESSDRSRIHSTSGNHNIILCVSIFIPMSELAERMRGKFCPAPFYSTVQCLVQGLVMWVRKHPENWLITGSLVVLGEVVFWVLLETASMKGLHLESLLPYFV
jgi:hypothetical protein